MKSVVYCFFLIFLVMGASLRATPLSDEDLEFERETLVGTTKEAQTASLSVHARFDAAYSGGEPTVQGFSIPHFYLGVDGVANPSMTYRLSIGPSREFSSTLIPQMVPTEAFFKITSVAVSEISEKPSLGVQLGMFSPALNPWWTPDLGDLWIPEFFVGQRQLLLTRDIGVELSANPIPDRLQVTAGFFNGNGVFGFNTNNSRAVTLFTRFQVPIGEWRLSVGGGGFNFIQGSAGSTNYRSHWIANPFINAEWEPMSLSATIEGWWGSFDDISQKKRPKGYVASLRLGHPRLQIFGRYLNLASTPSVGGFLQELHTGFLAHPLPHFDLFLYYISLRGRSAGVENSVNLRARFSL